MPKTPIAVRVPRDNVNDETVKLVNWAAEEGTKLEAGQLAAEIETSKSVMEVRAPEAGFLRRSWPVGAEVPVGEVLFHITQTPGEPIPEDRGAPRAVEGSRFSLKAQALMEQHGIEPEKFAGKGMVRESDVLALLEKGKAEAVGVPVQSEPLPRRKATEVKYLSGGQNDLASCVRVRCMIAKLDAFKSSTGGLLTPVIMFETARLLGKHKIFNAFYEDGAAHFYKEINIGFAIDADNGLKVPVIRGADGKSLEAIAHEMQDMMLRYVDDDLDAKSLSDGTFTITDLFSAKVYGISPLINYKQAAILAVGYIQATEIELALAFDHRLTEGRAAAAFLVDLKERLEGGKA